MHPGLVEILTARNSDDLRRYALAEKGTLLLEPFFAGTFAFFAVLLVGTAPVAFAPLFVGMTGARCRMRSV